MTLKILMGMGHSLCSNNLEFILFQFLSSLECILIRIKNVGSSVLDMFEKYGLKENITKAIPNI